MVAILLKEHIRVSEKPVDTSDADPLQALVDGIGDDAEHNLCILCGEFGRDQNL